YPTLCRKPYASAPAVRSALLARHGRVAAENDGEHSHCPPCANRWPRRIVGTDGGRTLSPDRLPRGDRGLLARVDDLGSSPGPWRRRASTRSPISLAPYTRHASAATCRR